MVLLTGTMQAERKEYLSENKWRSLLWRVSNTIGLSPGSQLISLVGTKPWLLLHSQLWLQPSRWGEESVGESIYHFPPCYCGIVYTAPCTTTEVSWENANRHRLNHLVLGITEGSLPHISLSESTHTGYEYSFSPFGIRLCPNLATFSSVLSTCQSADKLLAAAHC